MEYFKFERAAAKMAGASGFISRNTFFKKVEVQRELSDILNWTDSKGEEIFRIISIKKVEGKFGEVGILSIENRKVDESRVWCPSYLLKRVCVEEKPKSIAYFILLGQMSQRNKLINRFDVMF